MHRQKTGGLEWTWQLAFLSLLVDYQSFDHCTFLFSLNAQRANWTWFHQMCVIRVASVYSCLPVVTWRQRVLQSIVRTFPPLLNVEMPSHNCIKIQRNTKIHGLNKITFSISPIHLLNLFWGSKWAILPTSVLWSFLLHRFGGLQSCRACWGRIRKPR